jgi:tetratricopeptide (TPR) repeat protein
MNLYFRGMACMNKGFTAENLSEAGAFFAEAMALDPMNVDALVGKALADGHLVGSFSTDDRAVRLAAAETAAIGALSRAPDHALAHFALGVVTGLKRRNAEAIAECEHPLALDRNLAYAHMMIGSIKTALGRAEEAEGLSAAAFASSVRSA